MRVLKKILGGLAVLLIVTIIGFAITIGYTKDCEPIANPTVNGASMQAVRAHCYGGPEVLQILEVEKPVPGEGDVLVKIKAASVNPLDWHYMRGSPYFMRLMSGIGAPKDVESGVDFAGVVEAVGKGVTKFKVGDRVFGGRSGAFADYLVMPESKAIARIPNGVSFEQAAATPIAAVTAIQALEDIGKVKAGDKVLVNGASGGVGTYAVQMAKAHGAEVTGVSSTRNHAMVKALGADHMIDYKTHNYTEDDVKYDMIIDNIGNHSFSANADVLIPEGKLIMIGGSKGDWIGPMINPIKGMVQAPFLDQEFVLILAEMNVESLDKIAKLMSEGKVKSQIDKRYSLDQIQDAISYSESGRARGKIIINMD